MRQTHQQWIKPLLELSPSSSRDGEEQTYAKHALLRRVRWYVIGAQLAVMYPAWKTGYLVENELTIGIYLMIVAGLAYWNMSSKPLHVTGGIFLELTVDLLALTGLLILTSGCQNPFFSLLFVGAIMGPILLSRRWAVGYLVESALALALVCFFTEPKMVNAHGHEVATVLTVGVKILVIFIMGAMTLWLKDHWEQARIHAESLQRQRQRLNNFRAMGIVASQLSHELSTPLNTIKIMMDRLQRHSDGTHRQELRVAQAALQQCERSIQGLFATGVDAQSLLFKDTHLAPFIQSVCDKWHLDFPDVNLSVAVDEGTHDVITRIPVTPLAQAVLDLLDNAKEAADQEPADIR
ncbi:MAG: hypothetical protein M3Q07_08475, partial [Pseudobdellovibrionaceae bacterium]|nr:hypothetical protein [Pseudobdellovibrionaceae bacterium]